MPDYKFYMSRYVDNAWETAIDLETYYPGLKYISCKGLSDYGAVKNIYTESFAEEDGVSVYIPDNVVRESTDIEFEFGFEKENRRDTFHSFVEYLSGYIIKYWDTARMREVEMVLTDKVEVDDDILLGGSPYIVVTIKFKNLKGCTKKHTEENEQEINL